MKIYSVYDKEFLKYGRVFAGMEQENQEILKVLRHTPLPKGTGYVPEEPKLQELKAAKTIKNHCFGGMPVQLGWCNGHNTKLNCLEYHRSSEFNLGTDDFILLLARMDDIKAGKLNTSKVKAFRVPSGVMVEIFATTLHYAPCHTDAAKGFHVLVALPKGTNTEQPRIKRVYGDDELLWARNKWLLAHEESSEAGKGACVRLTGTNIDITEDLLRTGK